VQTLGRFVCFEETRYTERGISARYGRRERTDRISRSRTVSAISSSRSLSALRWSLHPSTAEAYLRRASSAVVRYPATARMTCEAGGDEAAAYEARDVGPTRPASCLAYSRSSLSRLVNRRESGGRCMRLDYVSPSIMSSSVVLRSRALLARSAVRHASGAATPYVPGGRAFFPSLPSPVLTQPQPSTKEPSTTPPTFPLLPAHMALTTGPLNASSQPVSSP